ncbi:MAG: hypothetical protein NUV77_09385, partial [Thermoguttaceae bacterium]|nr:hypothetical protein [Thermoguttaceae bacterium]
RDREADVLMHDLGKDLVDGERNTLHWRLRAIARSTSASYPGYCIGLTAGRLGPEKKTPWLG